MSEPSEDCEDCLEFDSYLCPEHRETVEELAAAGKIEKLGFYAMYDDEGGFASKVYGAERAVVAAYEEGLRQGAAGALGVLGMGFALHRLTQYCPHGTLRKYAVECPSCYAEMDFEDCGDDDGES